MVRQCNLIICSIFPRSRSNSDAKCAFLGFSKQSHAESHGNYVKMSFLESKRVKFDAKSEFGHVQWLFRSPGPVQWLSRRTNPSQRGRLIDFSQTVPPSFLFANLRSFH